MSLPFQRYIQVDSEGYWVSEGVRLNDEEYCQELLANIREDERGRFFVDTDGQTVAIEAFDEPMVASMVGRSGNDFVLRFPYGYEVPLNISSLVVDEWDRFHGRTDRGIPFVLSRPAQAELFNIVDEYDDDALIVNGERYVLGPWLEPFPESRAHEFWSERFGTENAGWELGKESPVFPEILPQIKIPRARILVLGCGSGHDAAFLARAGHIVTGVDFSPVAIDTSQKNYGDVKDLKFVEADVFKLPPEFTHHFDIVVEHTLLCAIPPEKRSDLVKVWRQVLDEGGHLLGIFWVRDKRKGPPWGATEWEIREHLRGGFNFRYWTRWRHSVEKRQGAELVVWAQKRTT